MSGPGGVYFETSSKIFEPGNFVKIDMSIPPTDGLLEFGGRVSGFAKVLRTHCLAAQAADDAAAKATTVSPSNSVTPSDLSRLNFNLPATRLRILLPPAQSYIRNCLPPTSSIQGRRPEDAQCDPPASVPQVPVPHSRRTHPSRKLR